MHKLIRLVLLFIALCICEYAFTARASFGRGFSSDSSVKRIVVLSSYWAETICFLQAEDKIVGIGNYVRKDPYIPHCIREKPTVGSMFTGINWETVLKLKPDLILGDDYGRYEEIKRKARELGIRFLALSPRSVEDNVKAIRTLGRILGKERTAEILCAWMETKINNARRIAQSIKKKKRVLVIRPITATYVSVLSKGSVYGDIVRLIGAHNVAFDKRLRGRWPKMDIERIIAFWKNCDAIVVLGWTEKEVRENVERIRRNDLWGLVKAVKDRNVYGVVVGFRGHFDWGPRIVVGIYEIGDIVYPELFPRWEDVYQELMKFYRKTK